mmetsp:Transcript_59134/g.69148  ORF Transcript_59134/g.69148 Transcript_59134/m.69148 type:complete len:117 (+) Transcript_59134:2471-2821(+)
MKKIAHDPTIAIIKADKKLGFCAINRKKFCNMMLTQYLQDKRTYKKLSKREMKNHRRKLKQDCLDIFDEAEHIITKAETTFPTHAVQGIQLATPKSTLLPKSTKEKETKNAPQGKL